MPLFYVFALYILLTSATGNVLASDIDSASYELTTENLSLSQKDDAVDNNATEKEPVERKKTGGQRIFEAIGIIILIVIGIILLIVLIEFLPVILAFLAMVFIMFSFICNGPLLPP